MLADMSLLSFVTQNVRFQSNSPQDDNEGHSHLLWKNSFDDAFQDDDDEPLVQASKLQHLKEHCQACPARLTSWGSGYFQSNNK